MGFFYGAKFVGSMDVPHDAHVWKVRHCVILKNPFEVDSSNAITWSNSHALKPQGVNEVLEFERGETKCQMHIPNHLCW